MRPVHPSRSPSSVLPAARRERRVLVALWMDCPFGTDTIEGFHERLAERGLSWCIRLAASPGAFSSAARWLLKERMIDGVATSAATSSDGPDFDCLAAWLRALPKPAAVVAANDDTAVDVADLCAACGIAVPRATSASWA